MEHRALRWRLGVLVMPCLLSCGLAVSFDDYGARSFSVRGDVIGLDPAQSVTLRLVTTRQVDSQRSQGTHIDVGNGAFAFATTLGRGAHYVITVDTNLLARTCTVQDGEGTIDDADARAVVSCSSESTTPGADGSSSAGASAVDICVGTINAYRAVAYLPPYEAWTENETCSRSQATSDGAADTYRTRYGQCGESAQNECGRWAGPPEEMIRDCLSVLFHEGPGGRHYDAMMSTVFARVSCAFGVAPDGKIWAIQNFH